MTKVTRKNKAYSILECLIASSIIIIIISLYANASSLIIKINKQSEQYLNILDTSQYLYWLFYNHIIENKGIKNFEYIDISNQKDNQLICSIISNQTYKINILDKVEIYTSANLTQELKKILNNKIPQIKSNTDIIKINYYELVNHQIQLRYKIYYIAFSQQTSNRNHRAQYSLYEYSLNNNIDNHSGYKAYSSELISNIIDMKLKKLVNNKTNNREAEYFFKFEYMLDNNKSEFIKFNMLDKICDICE